MSFLFEDVHAPLAVPDILMLLDLDEEHWLAKDAAPLVEPKAQDHNAKPKKKRKSPSTPRVRNKAKIELLHREVKSLKAELEALQQLKQSPATRPRQLARAHTEPVWKAIALRQMQERGRAERRNQDLKIMLSEQHVLTMLLGGALREWPASPGLTRST
jgi:phosphoribosylanthranilate isomerase